MISLGSGSPVVPTTQYLSKRAVDSLLRERPVLRRFFARFGLRFLVSAWRYRLRGPFGAPVSGRKNPVPNSTGQESAGGVGMKGEGHRGGAASCHNQPRGNTNATWSQGGSKWRCADGSGRD